MDNTMTYKDTIIENGLVYGRWYEGFKDEDSGSIVEILRHEAICYDNEVCNLKKKQSRLYKDKWVVYVYDEKEMEFPKIMFYLWKRGKTPRFNQSTK